MSLCLLTSLPPGLKRLSLAPHVLLFVTNPPLCFETGPERPDEKSRRSYLCGCSQTQQKWRVSCSSVSQTCQITPCLQSSVLIHVSALKQSGRVCISQWHEECHRQAWWDRTEWTEAENLWGQQKVSCFYFVPYMFAFVPPIVAVEELCIDIKTCNISTQDDFSNKRLGWGLWYRNC